MFVVSAVAVIASCASFYFVGLNFGTDFKGGTLMEVQAKSGPADLSGMRDALGKLNLGDFQLQQHGAHDCRRGARYSAWCR